MLVSHSQTPTHNPNEARIGHFNSRPSFTDRVLRLLAETSGDRRQMRARTVDDVSGASGALRVVDFGGNFLAPNASAGDAVKELR